MTQEERASRSYCTYQQQVDVYWHDLADLEESAHIEAMVQALKDALDGPTRRWNPHSEILVKAERRFNRGFSTVWGVTKRKIVQDQPNLYNIKVMAEREDVLEARAASLVENHEGLLRDLVALRKKHGLSQEVVAERMGVSQPAVAKFERYDANPRLSTLRRYAMAVGARLIDEVVDDHLVTLPLIPRDTIAFDIELEN